MNFKRYRIHTQFAILGISNVSSCAHDMYFPQLTLTRSILRSPRDIGPRAVTVNLTTRRKRSSSHVVRNRGNNELTPACSPDDLFPRSRGIDISELQPVCASARVARSGVGGVVPAGRFAVCGSRNLQPAVDFTAGAPYARTNARTRVYELLARVQRVHAGNHERAFIDLRSKVHRALPLPHVAATPPRVHSRVSPNNNLHENKRSGG